jgi:hypothetical protein
MYFSPNILRRSHEEKNGMACSMCGEMRNEYTSLAEKSGKHRNAGNIKIGLRETRN